MTGHAARMSARPYAKYTETLSNRETGAVHQRFAGIDYGDVHPLFELSSVTLDYLVGKADFSVADEKSAKALADLFVKAGCEAKVSRRKIQTNPHGKLEPESNSPVYHLAHRTDSLTLYNVDVEISNMKKFATALKKQEIAALVPVQVLESVTAKIPSSGRNR